MLAFGEGAHNTHHASPRSARHGLYWVHFDLSWQLIKLLARLNWVTNVYILDPNDLLRAIDRNAPGAKIIPWVPLGRPNLRKDVRGSAVD